MMRVLMIYIEPAPYILDLIRVLREQYPQLHLHVLFITEADSQPWGKLATSDDMELLPSGRAAAIRRIFELSRGGSFDWVHLAGWGHFLLTTAIMIGAFHRKSLSMESDTQLRAQSPCLKQWLKRVVLPRLFSQITLFLPGGSRQKALLEHYGVPESSIRIAQMTVDVNKITELCSNNKKNYMSIRDGIGINPDNTVFVFVGRLEPHKGITLLLDAFSTLSLNNIELMIVGDGSSRDEVELAASADERIHYLGRRDFSGVIEALSVANVAIVPSHVEPWGLVVNEAMAAGLPVIASTSVGATDDLIKDGTNGRLFENGNIKSLASAMWDLATNRQLQIQYGIAAGSLIKRWDLAAESKIMYEGWIAGLEPNN